MTRLAYETFLAVVIITVSCMFPVAAEEEGYESEPKPTIDFSVKMGTDVTSNIYSASANAESASVFVVNLYGTASYPKGPAQEYTLDLDITQNDYLTYPEEDYKDVSATLGYERRLSDHTYGELTFSFDETDASRQAVNSLSSREIFIQGKFTKAVTSLDIVSLKAWTEQEKYKDYESLMSEGHGYGISLSHYLGGFSYLEIEFESDRIHYPNEFIIDSQGNQTTGHRSDKADTFVVTVSKVYSLYPLTYLQVSYEQTKNKSDSSEYYLWYDPVKDTIPTKVLPGPDSYNEQAISIYGLKDLNDKTTLSVYYLHDKIDYPSRLLGNLGDAEPVEPMANRMTYFMIDLQRKISEKLSLKINVTRIASSSNDSLYTYVEHISSYGVVSTF